jgi:hypothetical protein
VLEETETPERAARRAGEILAEMARKGERDNGRGNRNPALKSSSAIPKLSDLGITNDQASQWQQLARRNLTKGQQAMALAVIHPEPERGRGKKDEARKEAESASFSYRRVKVARTVLRLASGQNRKTDC